MLERELDGLDGALDAGTVAARGREENALDHAGIVALPTQRSAWGSEKSPRLGGVGVAGFSRVLAAG